MRAHGLIDTGALLALLDRDDRWHRACADAFASLRLPLATTGAVLAEFFHLLGHNRREVSEAWSLLRSGAIAIAALDDSDLRELEALMARYHDRPIDFADASLVRIAQREALTTILTIDNDDFETYRIGNKKRFRILPGRI